ncbi:MAG: hypothetical protein Q8P73_05720 [bacterium]|nr:hypothetical protein [bacterium]
MRRYFALILMVALFLGYPTMNTFAANIPDKLKEAVLYLGVGEATGPGKIVKVNLAGENLGEIPLGSLPSGVCVSGGNIYAALPSDGTNRTGTGKVVEINSEGVVSSSLIDNRLLRKPLSIAARDDPPALFVGCNHLDHVVRLDPNGSTEVVFSSRSSPRIAQNYEIAVTNDLLLVITDYPNPGVTAVELSSIGSRHPHKEVLPFTGMIAAKRNSNRWAATQVPMRRSRGRYIPKPNAPVFIHVFEGMQEVRKIPCLKNNRLGWNRLLTFCGDYLVVAYLEDYGHAIYLLDIDSGQSQMLFRWKGERMVALAATL